MNQLPPTVEVRPAGPLSGRLNAPPSKSVTNRLLVMASLARGTSRLRSPLVSDDTDAMAEGIEAFGAQVERTADAWAVTGASGRMTAPRAPVDARQSGTTLRFLAALAVLAEGSTTIGGAPSLLRRPIGALAEVLRSLGVAVQTEGDRPPIVVEGGRLGGGRVVVDASESSQFVSALLLVAPYAESEMEIEATGIGAAGYVDLTADLMRRSGADVRVLGRDPYKVAVSPGAAYSAHDVTVEYDASAAAHLLALAVASGGEITVTNAGAPTSQPDTRVVEVFSQMGAELSADASGVTVHGPAELYSLDVDLSGMPDQLPTVAALTALARGTSRLSGLKVARGHESDRVAAMAEELRKLGAVVAEGEDWLEVSGGLTALKGAVVDSHDDHRIAMSLAAIGTRVPGVVIRGARCVGKTYPGFFGDAARLGMSLTAHD